MRRRENAKATSSLSIIAVRVDLNCMIGKTSQLDLIQRQLAITTARHNVASNNIANVNTPGFKAKELVHFEDELSKANLERHLVENSRRVGRLDGNPVDIHYELGALKKNALMHNAFTQLMAAKIRQLQRAISSS